MSKLPRYLLCDSWFLTISKELREIPQFNSRASNDLELNLHDLGHIKPHQLSMFGPQTCLKLPLINKISNLLLSFSSVCRRRWCNVNNKLVILILRFSGSNFEFNLSVKKPNQSIRSWNQDAICDDQSLYGFGSMNEHLWQAFWTTTCSG